MFYLVMLIGVGLSVGCQTFHPFKKSVQQKAATLRDWTNSGLEAVQGGRLAQAKSFFSRAADQSPKDTRARVNLARTDARMGDHDQAIKHMEAAIGLASDDAALRVELGELYLQVGRWKSARQQADMALELNPRLAQAWALSGKTWHARQDYGKALADYQRSLGFDANTHAPITAANYEVQMLVVSVYETLGKPTRALSAVEQLLSSYPPDRQPEEALLAKGNALMTLNQHSPAADVLAIACAREDASVEAFMRLAQAQVSAGRMDQAHYSLQHAQTRFPDASVVGELIQSLPMQKAAVASLEHQTEPLLVR